jgi:tetratricopeptide (TPR) repeat protein
VLNYITLFIFVFLITSCSVKPHKNESLDPLAHDNQTDYQVIKPGSQTGDAVKALLVDARGAASSGNIDRAESLLERALRIEPRNAVLWHYMAKMKLHQGRYSKAIGMAAKSNSMVRGDKALMADNWRIIAHAENWLGNIDKSQKAQQRADQLIR